MISKEKTVVTMPLAEFVGRCNACTRDMICPSDPALDGPARQLGNGMMRCLQDGNEADGAFSDPDDRAFYISLIERGCTDEYIFEQDNNIVAKISPFAPFLNMEETKPSKQILSQKWHVLIALLAYLDTASCYDFKGVKDKSGKNITMENEAHNIGKIKEIQFDVSKRILRVTGENKKKCYPSRQMNEWLFGCLVQ